MPDRVEPPALPQASPRLRLAHVAAAAATAFGGVLALDPGRGEAQSTRGGGELVRGVSVLATGAGGRYSVDLFVRAQLRDLRALGDELRAAVREAVALAGLADALGPVGVTITDVDGGAA